MMFRLATNRFALAALALCFLGTSYGADLSTKAAPRKWLEPLMPEDLPKLTHPQYYEDLDKARAQLAAGRYKLALATLYAAKNVDPLEAALVRGAALDRKSVV